MVQTAVWAVCVPSAAVCSTRAGSTSPGTEKVTPAAVQAEETSGRDAMPSRARSASAGACAAPPSMATSRLAWSAAPSGRVSSALSKSRKAADAYSAPA